MSSLKTINRRHFSKLLGAGSLAATGLSLPSIAQAATPITIAVPNPSALSAAPLFCAIGEGYFAEQGLDVNVEIVDGSASVLQAMSAGQAQIGAPGPGPVLGARARGVPVTYIYNLYPKSIFGLLVNDTSSYKSPSDIKGQVIGVGTADGAEVSFAQAVMVDAGLKQDDDFTFLPVGDGGGASIAFTRGDIAAYAGAIFDEAVLKARGVNLREITPSKFLGFFGNGFAAMKPYMDENAAVVDGFGKAMVQGMRFSIDPANLESVFGHCAKANPQESENVDFAKSILDVALRRMTPTKEYAHHGFGYMPPEHWEGWQSSLIASGALSEPLPDLSEVYSNGLIASWNS